MNKEADFLSKIKNRLSNYSNTIEEEKKYDDKKSEDNLKTSEDKDKVSIEFQEGNGNNLNCSLTDNNGLTPEEKAEKEILLATGFNSWNKHEFHVFVQGCERFSRKDYFKISEVKASLIKFIITIFQLAHWDENSTRS